jgi:predicted enzyme related to lactoylglutathione lyase
MLYLSWLEIPVEDMARALAFYRALFGLTETPRFDEPPALIAVLSPSDKAARRPGVSLVQSPDHRPSLGGALANFHLGDHRQLGEALNTVTAYGGQVRGPLTTMDDGVRYVLVRDCEGNTIALSSYDPPPPIAGE